MDELPKILRVLLKRMPYELYFRNDLDCMTVDTDILRKAMHAYMPAYSDTEIQYMLESLEDSLRQYTEFRRNGEASGREEVSVFEAIFCFSNQMLLRMNNEVMCHYDDILRWRMTTVDISEELFVAAFLAQKDLENGIYCKDFTWPTVISHNNMQLRSLTRKGMAENHFHLWGSAPYFHIAWIRMMNDMIGVEYGAEFDKMDSKMRTQYQMYDKRYQEKDMRRCCLQAALIRVFLFSILTNTQILLGEYYVEWKQLVPWIQTFHGSIAKNKLLEIFEKMGECSGVALMTEVVRNIYSEQDEEWRKFVWYLPALQSILSEKTNIRRLKYPEGQVSLQDIISFLLQEKGEVSLQDCRRILHFQEFTELWQNMTNQKFMYYLKDYEVLVRHIDQVQDAIDSIGIEDDERPVDYALTAIDFAGYQERDTNYVLSGERRFIYEMFRRIDSRDRSLSPMVYNLFYAYLIMKEKVRSEMVQSNDWVGFENFAIYQDRKDYFSKGRYFEQLKAKMAVMSCMEQNVKLLEIRISPGNTVRENYDKIYFLDHAIDADGEWKEKFFYVLHFIKKPDDEIKTKEFCGCRHSVLRGICEKKTLALMEFRQIYPETAKRVLGIDAAVQEIGCRPEVFAQAFRTLKNHTSFIYTAGEFEKLPQLRATYHVGEDFLDIVDGLRAIDEAILYLNLDCGDRLGHALALGIDVEDWYRTKAYHISLPKQDYLDNLVWLYFAIVRYQIYCLDNLKNYIEAEFRKYFSEIFGYAMKREDMDAILEKANKNAYRANLIFDIHTYYDAWKLRGDAPELYKKGFFDKNSSYVAPFEVNAVNSKFPSDFNIRYKPEVAMLYYYYHYDRNVRLEGRKKADVKVSEAYIKGVELVQQAMQKEIAQRGIGIETNPSSNYMIGTFKRYDKHPILRFYNNGLTYDSASLAASPQIWTSINTDDKGVFNISLENEYALLARAVERIEDADGQPMYQKTMIYEWLDKIREMGIRQSFGNREEDRQERGKRKNKNGELMEHD